MTPPRRRAPLLRQPPQGQHTLCAPASRGADSHPQPRNPRQEIDDVKARLRDYADRVTRGESDFSTLAILYSEAPRARRRNRLHGTRTACAEYAAVAFNLNDPKKVSKIVETEYGYHIIQLIEKRGDRINTRHILLRPKVAKKDLDNAKNRLDTLRAEIVDKKNRNFRGSRAPGVAGQGHPHEQRSDVNSADGTTRFEMSQRHRKWPKPWPRSARRGIAALRKCATQARPRHWPWCAPHRVSTPIRPTSPTTSGPSRDMYETPAARKSSTSGCKRKSKRPTSASKTAGAAAISATKAG